MSPLRQATDSETDDGWTRKFVSAADPARPLSDADGRALLRVGARVFGDGTGPGQPRETMRLEQAEGGVRMVSDNPTNQELRVRAGMNISMTGTASRGRTSTFPRIGGTSQ
jgi:hypothetical protein